MLRQCILPSFFRLCSARYGVLGCVKDVGPSTIEGLACGPCMSTLGTQRKFQSTKVLEEPDVQCKIPFFSEDDTEGPNLTKPEANATAETFIDDQSTDGPKPPPYWADGVERATESPSKGVVRVQGRQWTFETGRLAKFADGSCTLRSGETTVLSTTSCSSVPYLRRDPGFASLPLTVDYREKLYAVGRIPGTYNKREGSPKEHELLTGRRLERAIKSLIPRGYVYPTDVTAAVLSADGGEDPEILAINATSVAFEAAGIPWYGPMGGVRVAITPDNKVIIAPTPEIASRAICSLLIGATRSRIVLLEMESSEGSVRDELVIQAIKEGLTAVRSIIDDASNSGVYAMEKRNGMGRRKGVTTVGADPMAARRVWPAVLDAVSRILRSPEGGDCLTRDRLFQTAKSEIAQSLKDSGAWRGDFVRVPGSGCVSPTDLDHVFEAAIGSELRRMVLQDGIRPDGRGPIDLRAMSIEADHVPIVHGSSVTDVGHTQVLCTATVGSKSEQQKIESLLGGEGAKQLFVHYSLPDYAVIRSTRGRSERPGTSSITPIIGGPVAWHELDRSYFIEKALSPLLPPESRFPFTLRLNTDVLAADGGVVAAAVCGNSVALADAGVPMKELVAGVSLCLLSEAGQWDGEAVAVPSERATVSDDNKGHTDIGESIGSYEILVDPTELEVALGDMELQIAGTTTGITAIQLDARLPGGIPDSVVLKAFERAQTARVRMINYMQRTILSHNDDSTAIESSVDDDSIRPRPRFGWTKVPTSAIGAVIGKEGSGIRAIESASGAKVHVGDAGEVAIFAPTLKQYQSAHAAIGAAAGTNLVVGNVYEATVVSIKDFGAFVSLPDCDLRALLHISDVSLQRIRAVDDVVKVGDAIQVAFTGRDARGSLRVSRKAVLQKQKEAVPGKQNDSRGA